MAFSGNYGLQILVDGKPLNEIAHGGKLYVAAPIGKEFEIRITSPWGERSEGVLSVDGRSVMETKEASVDDRGYVFSGGQDVIKGFRLNDDEVAHFKFSRKSRSYAAQSGDASNVGVIAVTFFREQVYRPRRGFSMRGGGLESTDAAPASAGVGHDVGTGFGDRTDDKVSRTTFIRQYPAVCTLVIEYASKTRLQEAGILKPGLGNVNPFPGDPPAPPGPGCDPPPGWDGGKKRGRRKR